MDETQGIAGLCAYCPKREKCQKACGLVENILNQGRVTNLWEINHGEDIELCRPRWNVTRFSGIKKDISGDQKEAFDEEMQLEFNTDKLEMTQTKIFIEKFFKQRSYHDIADQLNIDAQTVRHYYRNACRIVGMLADILDKRRSGIKYLMNRNSSEFSYDEQAFLLNQVFGYSTTEVAEMLGHYSQPSVKIKVRRMKNKYKAAFAAVDSEES